MWTGTICIQLSIIAVKYTPSLASKFRKKLQRQQTISSRDCTHILMAHVAALSYANKQPERQSSLRRSRYAYCLDLNDNRLQNRLRWGFATTFTLIFWGAKAWNSMRRIPRLNTEHIKTQDITRQPSVNDAGHRLQFGFQSFCDPREHGVSWLGKRSKPSLQSLILETKPWPYWLYRWWPPLNTMLLNRSLRKSISQACIRQKVAATLPLSYFHKQSRDMQLPNQMTSRLDKQEKCLPKKCT